MGISDRRDEPSDVDPSFLEAVIESGLGPVLTVDDECTVRYASRRVAELLGVEPDELVGRSLAAIVAPTLEPDRAAALRERFSSDRVGADGPLTFPAVCADGVERVLTFDARRHTHDGELLYSGKLHTGGHLSAAREDPERPTADGETDPAAPRDQMTGSREEDAFHKIVECAGHGIYITDTAGEIQYVNAAFEELTGYEAAELLGETPAILNSGEMSDEYFDRLWRTLERGEVWTEEIVDRRKRGEPYHAHQTIAPVFDGDEIVRYVAIQTDVTRQKETEERLRTYRNVVELLEDPIMLQNRDGEFELTNAAVSEFAGRSRVTLHGNDEFAFMDDCSATRIAERKRSVLESEAPAEYDVDVTFPYTDCEATFNTKRYPYYDSDGELVGTVAICRDVTAIERRQEELRRYERAITGATDLIAAVDEENRYLFANPEYAEFHGIDAQAVKGKRIDDVLPNATYENLERDLARARRGKEVSFRMTRTHPTKGERTLDVQYYPLQEDADTAGVVAVLRDVTDRENRTRQLRVVDRVLQHNIRNDLTLITGHAERIRESARPEIAEAADVVLEHADDLLTTSEKSRAVTEILSEPPAQRPVDVAASVRAVRDSTARSHPNARLSADVPAEAMAFSTPELDRAIEELVTNAIVHHDREEPRIDIGVESRDDRILIRVRDDGPGISEMNRAVAEEGAATDALYHGSGLGMWLVYWVLTRSGGSVDISDVEPRGVEVTLSVPAYGPEDEAVEIVDDRSESVDDRSEPDR